MKIMVASDIHGSAYYCRQLFDCFQKEQPDRLLLLGDLLYHGPRNDLPKEYCPKEVIAMLNARKDSLLCVRGNCDTVVDQMVLDFPILAEYCVLEWNGHLIYASHGHHDNPQTPPPMRPGDILLNGHTHVADFQKLESGFYLNPGSVSIPKQNTPRGYLLLEDEGIRFQTLEGVTYRKISVQDLHND